MSRLTAIRPSSFSDSIRRDSALRGARPRNCVAHDHEADAAGDADGNGRRGGGAVDATAHEHDEQVAERDVQQVEEDLERDHVAHALTAQQPADDDIEDEIERRREHADVIVAAGDVQGVRSGIEHREAQHAERHHQQDQRETEDDGEPERPQEGRALLALIPRAEGLGGEPGGADAQEAEGPEDEASDGGAEGDAAEVEPGAGAANQGGIDDRRKHRRQVGENGRDGDRQNPAVHRLEPEVRDRDGTPDRCLINAHD